MVIVLHREFAAGSVGITLAGGADYESKEITVSLQGKQEKNFVFKLFQLRFFYVLSASWFKVGPLFFLKVHKVIPGTLADRDGRIQKGDRVLSINGKSTKGVTHREALSILKVSIEKNVL